MPTDVMEPVAGCRPERENEADDGPTPPATTPLRISEVHRNAPVQLDVHLILGNNGTHKTALIRHWLLKHLRFHVHFTPTSAFWLNLVERWVALLTEKPLRRKVHRRTQAPRDAILAYIAYTNKPTLSA